MQKKKGVLLGLFSVMTFCALSGFAACAVGPSEWSYDSSNTTGDKMEEIVATDLALGDTVTDNLASSEEDDWYKFTIPADGYINIGFTHEIINSDATNWKIYLYESDGFTICDDGDANWSVSGSVDCTIGKVGILAGDYYIKITDANSWSDVFYSFNIEFVYDNTWEVESNDSAEKANILEGIRQGSIANSSDEDWYRVSISSGGKVALLFNHKYVDTSSTCWKVTIYASDASTEIAQFDIKGDESATEEVFSAAIGTYFIKVSKGSYNIGREVTIALRQNMI